ncbi:hypothetical protein FIE12Z_5945 [Fusarium flagelliforme]|uniref:Rhodopsin domain-containing protein n=1 Tax=Fusarium flagelliforme TaxID=2675880 RepID=A0A395MPV7_9HYPO|nr:hypothetical protein FIE12Z_5945 [Fusarium flagelliforme]
MTDRPDDLPLAMLYEAASQTFAIIGMSIAKASLGLFLLRLVKERWHKIAIWSMMTCLFAASVCVCFVYWFQCTPPRYLWDRRIPGRCTIDTAPVALTLCIFCVVADFFFAGFPWLFILGLQMKMKEKIVILSSFSLGIIAGAFGIKRTLEVPKLTSPNHTKDPMGLIVWTAAEITVTMVCIGIPVCRPLYKKYFRKWTTRNSSNYPEHNSGASYPLQTIGGGIIPAKRADRNGSGNTSDTHDKIMREHERKLGIGSSLSRTKVYPKGDGRFHGDDQSEEILGPEFRRSQILDLEAQGGGTQLTREITTSERSI